MLKNRRLKPTREYGHSDMDGTWGVGFLAMLIFFGLVGLVVWLV